MSADVSVLRLVCEQQGSRGCWAGRAVLHLLPLLQEQRLIFLLQIVPPDAFPPAATVKYPPGQQLVPTWEAPAPTACFPDRFCHQEQSRWPHSQYPGCLLGTVRR